MIGLDTNILVRYIVRDDQTQAELATRLIEEHCTREDPGFISLIVLIELVWVLSRGYGYPKAIVTDVLTKLLSSAELLIEETELAWAALRGYMSGSIDYPDHLIGLVSSSHGCTSTFTLDKRAGRNKLYTLLNKQ